MEIIVQVKNLQVIRVLTAGLLFLVLILFPRIAAFCEASPSLSDVRRSARALYQEGNYKEAYEKYRESMINASSSYDSESATDLRQAVDALTRLNRIGEFDGFVEELLAQKGVNTVILEAASKEYLQIAHYGYLLDGEFSRGWARGGTAKTVNVEERDRVRAIQLIVRAIDQVERGRAPALAAPMYIHLADALKRSGSESWRFAEKSDISRLPEYEDGFTFNTSANGAPVDERGEPIFYGVPKAFETAVNDGERWRFALSRAAALNPSLRDSVKLQFADFLADEFDVRTLSPNIFHRFSDENDSTLKTSTYNLSALSAQETIAKLAIGVRRFSLPSEFNFIAIYKEVSSSQTGDGLKALESLARVYSDRRHYEDAATVLKEAIKRYGTGSSNERQKRLDQIVGAWGQFEQSSNLPAGSQAKFGFKFRNATSVTFKAESIDIESLLTDTMEYIKSSPKSIQWSAMNLHDVGYRIVTESQTKYVGEQVARWTQPLEPRANHFDTRITIDSPLSKPGAYLVTAEIAGGNTSRMILWINDTALLRKDLESDALFYLADAVTGKPLSGVSVETFGYRQVWNQQSNSYTFEWKKLTGESDSKGIATIKSADLPQAFQWLTIAKTRDGRLAFQGFQSSWFGRGADEKYDQLKVYGITDRPVYRPNQTAHFKVWLRRASYGDEADSPYSGRTVTLKILNPKGEVVKAASLIVDRWGGIETDWIPSENDQLGLYQFFVENYGQAGTFRLEEYKKPEFEVVVKAPEKPVKLGDKVPVTISARYYFGAPVSKGKLHYKVQRSDHSAQWFPPGRWDWLFGPGYWWFAPTYDWYPHFSRWGCVAPWPWWMPRNSNVPPEIVAEQTIDLGESGSVTVDIDTELAKVLYSNSDHRYQVTAEVVDESRRTIVGTASILVAREPFAVHTWLDKGYYKSGETIFVSATARTLDGAPVSGLGKATLFRISYDAARNPVEKPLQTFDVSADADGQTELQLTAAQPGQYRFSYTLTDSSNHQIESGYVFSVLGEDSKTEDFKYNGLEIIPDRREYRPGESVRLLINSDRADTAILLFLRPANGRYPRPEFLQLKGRSTVHEFKVERADMPNFFVEGVTVHDAEVFTVTKEIVVPPEDKILDVKLRPSTTEFKPGAEAELEIKVTDPLGKAIPSSAVVAVYDRSIEYVTGGSLTPNIQEFFWKWRRRHSPYTNSNLGQTFGPLLRLGELGMQPLGIFGSTVFAEENEASKRQQQPRSRTENTSRMPMKALDLSATEGMTAGASLPPAPAEQLLTQEANENQPQELQPIIRSEFADTAYWNGLVSLDARGVGIVKFRMPENLTSWKIRSWAVGENSRVGEATTEVATTKKVLVRVQTPRFFVEQDEVVISANVHNYLGRPKSVRVKIEVPGNLIEISTSPEKTVEIAPGGSHRLDWRAKVKSEGEAIVRVLAFTDEESDAMEVKVPVKVHGIRKTESFSSSIRPDNESASIRFTVPEERIVEQSSLVVGFSPSLALSMVDALPYLANYPYGCTEQTLNRFLPTVVVLNELKRLGISLDEVRKKRVNLNAQQLSNPTEVMRGLGVINENPVFDEDAVVQMTKAGVARLASMQLDDGGWGWFSGSGERSSAHTTVTVVRGLRMAREAGVQLPSGVLERGMAWLSNYEAAQLRQLKNAATKTIPYKAISEPLDVLVHMVLVENRMGDPEIQNFLHRDRLKMPVYALVMLGLTYDELGDIENRSIVVKNVEQYLVQDDENQTAYLNLGIDNYWWYWYGSEIEAHSYYLKLLSRIDGSSSTASRIAKYLVNNRRNATYWNSTRDTALAIEALAEFTKRSGQSTPQMELDVYLDGRKVHSVSISKDNLFSFDGGIVMTGSALTSGEHEVKITRKGGGEVYLNAYVTNFTKDHGISKAGLEIKVERSIYRLTRVAEATALRRGSNGQAIGTPIEKYRREKLISMSGVESGDLLEVELEIESKNDYEYIIVEDFKPAGVEPVNVQSGYSANDLGAYVEYRDDKVSFFVRTLPRGKRNVAYRVRAETIGNFSALPTVGSGMYAPELRANSDEFRLGINEAAVR